MLKPLIVKYVENYSCETLLFDMANCASAGEWEVIGRLWSKQHFRAKITESKQSEVHTPLVRINTHTCMHTHFRMHIYTYIE